MNLLTAGIFATMFIMFLAIISGSSYNTQSLIQKQFNVMTCPMPASSGLWNSSGTLMYTNGTYNYQSVSSKVLTLTCSKLHTADNVDYFYGQPTVAIGVFFFIDDYLASFVEKAGAFFTIVATVLTPAGFNILGFTINSIGTFAQIIVFSLYTICYILMGTMVYKILSPFGGSQ